MSTQETPMVATSAKTPVLPKKKGMRKMTWLIIGWTVTNFVWTMVALAQSGDGTQTTEYQDCIQFNSPEDCKTAFGVGQGIGVGLAFMVWFVGFIILAIIWAMTKPKDAPVVVVQAAAAPAFTQADVQAEVEKALARERENARERAESLEIDAQIEREREQ